MSQTVPFRFIHCADLHLDSPFEGIAAESQGIARALRNATFEAFDNIVALAVEERADFVVVSGDVYDGELRSLRAQWRFSQALDELCDKGIPCFIVHGNHDPLESWDANLDLPSGVHRFGGSAVESAVARRGQTPLAHVYGISFPRRDVHDNLSLLFQREPDAPFAIGALHCNVGGDRAHESYAPCSAEDLGQGHMDYWALGHIHTRRTIGESRPFAVYPGNPQGRNPRETGPRGCYLVEVDDAAGVSPHFVETDVIRWFAKEVRIEGTSSKEALLAQVQDTVEDVRREADGRAAIVRLSLSGRGGVHGQYSPDELADTARQWAEDDRDRRDFVWIESIADATRPTIDVDSRRQVEDFVGEFLRAAEELRSSDQLEAAVDEILGDRPEHRLVAEYLAALEDADLRHLLDQAETLGLDLLFRDEE